MLSRFFFLSFGPVIRLPRYPSASFNAVVCAFFRVWLRVRRIRRRVQLCAFFALFFGFGLVWFVSIRCVVCMLNFIAIQQMCANVFCVLFSHAFGEMVLTCWNMHATYKPVRNTVSAIRLNRSDFFFFRLFCHVLRGLRRSRFLSLSLSRSNAHTPKTPTPTLYDREPKITMTMNCIGCE